MAPVPPALPHAPQVSQLVESSMLSITLRTPGGGGGVGEGAGPGVGVGVGDGVGTGVDPGPEDGGFPCALTVTGAMLLPPPQAVSVKVARIKAVWIKTVWKSEGDRQRFKETSVKFIVLVVGFGRRSLYLEAGTLVLRQTPKIGYTLVLSRTPN